MQARRIRPDTGALDRRRLAAAVLSALLPGLGQLYNGRRRLAALFLIPSLVLILVALVAWSTQSPTQLAATIAAPAVLNTLLSISLVFMALRLLSVVQAFLDTRWHGPTGRVGLVGLIVICALVVLPHALAYQYGVAFRDAFAQIFDREGNGGGGPDTPGQSAAPVVGIDTDDRFNVLLVGVDTNPTAARETVLTDTMLVASVDPVGDTVSLMSIPRDLVRVPLGNGDVYGPKLNSLYQYAESHPDEFPDGGMQALQDAIGALLGIDIDHHATIDFIGFVDMIDAVGGVDVDVTQAFDDPTYDGYGWGDPGFAVDEGTHHFDGVTALAYARARKALGESDFTRAARQQQVLVALRNAAMADGSLLWELPSLLDAVGDTVSTDVPSSALPSLAAIVDQIGDDAVVRAVIRHPLVKSRNTEYGSSLVPDVEAIQAVAADLFPAPGGEPKPWPTPKPTKTPAP